MELTLQQIAEAIGIGLAAGLFAALVHTLKGRD